MTAKSDYLENKVLDHVLGGVDYARPATVYMALFTAAPSDTGGGTEVSSGGYARAAITNNATNWPAASGGQKKNGAAVAFPTPSADWGTVVAAALFDSAAGGNLLYYGVLAVARVVRSGDAVSFPINTITVGEL